MPPTRLDSVHGCFAGLRQEHDALEQHLIEAFDSVKEIAQELERSRSAGEGAQEATSPRGEDEMRQRVRKLEDERSELENELETVREHTYQLSETLSETKRLLEHERAQWQEERNTMLQSAPPTSDTQSVPDKSTGSDTTTDKRERKVVDSVMAQFEKVQHQHRTRRHETQGRKKK